MEILLVLILGMISELVAYYFIFTMAPEWVTTPLIFLIIAKVLAKVAAGTAKSKL